jgi:hypothetical protein
VRASELPLLPPYTPIPSDHALMAERAERILDGRSTEYIRLSDIMGATEVSEATGVGQTYIRATKRMPKPIHKIRATSIYHGDEVRRFAERRTRPA